MQSPMSLDAVLNVEAQSEEQFVLAVPDGWQQGKGAFGGLVLGAMVRAATLRHADPTRPIRSISAEILAPVLVGPAEIRVEPLRVGEGTSTLRVAMLQETAYVAHLVIVPGATRPDTPAISEPPPPLPHWQDVPVTIAGPPVAPVFTQNFEFRATGPLPLSGAREARCEGWIRARERSAKSLDVAQVLALSDAYWPALAVTLDRPRPFGTMSLLVQIIGDMARLDPEAPLFHRGRCPALSEGYAVELRELWSAERGIVAISQQTCVVIK